MQHSIDSISVSKLIPILYEEPHFLLVNKPAGILTQAVPGIDSLQTLLTEQIKLRDSHSGTPFIGLPHRLDRATSGVVLIARNQRALGRFGDQFHHRLVQKFYLSWVEGEITVADKWSDWIRKVKDEPRAEIVGPSEADAKLAEMLVQPLCHSQGQSLVLVKLLTGRMHQIRLQFASRGMHVLGDGLYGAKSRLSDDPDERRRPHGLHALRLEFRHPQTAIPLAITAPAPEYWQQDAAIYAACEKIVERSQQQIKSVWDWPVPVFS
ncbi:MAG: RluA family pseudouridine synthase [Pirellulales bacterium]